MDRLTCTLQPATGRFAVPYSTGYQTYSGLLSLLDDADTALAEEVHNTPFGSLTNSGLLGTFDYSINREYHKGIRPDESYELRIGVTHPDDDAVFEALTKALVIDNVPLELADGAFDVTAVEPESSSHEEILTEASEVVEEGARGVTMTFETPTCCSRYGEVWDAHPDRVHVFSTLSDRWNATAPSGLQLTPTEKSLGSELYTVADTDAYGTRSIVVHRREPDSATCADSDDTRAVSDGGEHLNEAQGFLGTWEFNFKGASEATKTAVLALARYAEFAGVGRHTARGAGTVSTTVHGV